MKNRLRITENNATLKDISLPANAVGMLETEVNFLSEVIPQDKTFTFDIAMYDSKGKTLYGGEHYKAIRDDNRTFDVVAMQNQTAMPEEPVTFSAVNIGEPATYLWYNATGDSIASGTMLSTTATQSQQYRLPIRRHPPLRDPFHNLINFFVRFCHHLTPIPVGTVPRFHGCDTRAFRSSR